MKVKVSIIAVEIFFLHTFGKYGLDNESLRLAFFDRFCLCFALV